MEIELDKLKCSRDKLISLVRAVLKIRPRALHMKVKDHTLTLHGSNDDSDSVTIDGTIEGSIDHLVVRIPYLGEDYECYADKTKLVDALKAKGKILTIPTRGQPIAWDDAPEPLKKLEKVEYSSAYFFDVMKFLLSADVHRASLPKYRGVVFTGSEAIAMDGTVIYVQENMPALTTSPVLYGHGAARSFKAACEVIEVPTVRGVHKHKATADTIYFEAEDEDGIEVRSYSIPRCRTDNLLDFRQNLAITPHSIGIVVHQTFLKEVATYVYRKKAHMEIHANSVFQYKGTISDGKTTVCSGEIPMIRSMPNQSAVDLVINPRYLLDLIREGDGETQIIVPCHPEYHFKYYEVTPIIVNCVQGRYAVISLMTHDSERARRLIHERAYHEEQNRS